MGIETLAIASLAATVIGGGITAYGQYSTGQATKAAADYRAQVARNNAAQARAIGDVDAQRQGIKTGNIIGKQTAQQGASGLTLDNSGSGSDVRASTAEMGMLDTLTILNNARNKGIGLENEALLDTFSGKAAETEGDIKATGSIISSAGSVSDRWMSYRDRGYFG